MNFNSKLLSSLLLVLLMGCASSTSEYPQYSGFLSNYKGLYRSSEVEDIFLVKHRTKAVNEYSKFMVNPVTVQLTRDALAYNMKEDALKRIAVNFSKEIVRALQKNGTVVQTPGEGVLLVRVAITDILKGNSLSSANGTVEAEFFDTQTNERIAAVVTSTEGMYLDQWAALLSDRIIYLNSETKVYKFDGK